jgi:hypothetical protein
MSLIKVKSRGTDNVSGRKNIFINGDMVIAQRGTSATTTGGYHNIDRWNYQHSTDGGFSGTQSSDVPSGTGFTKSLLWTVTSADSSFSSGQFAYIRQVVEGQNCAHLKLGTSDAKTITLSFYVKSSVTGTFSGAMCNDGFNRSYPYTYTINSANTWEKKSVTIPCDTSGTWKIDNDRGFFMTWALGSGSQYLGTAGQWNASGQIAATGTTNLMATNGATWYLTGCQVEVGDSATDFEHRSFGEELSLCKRYYEKSFDYGATPGVTNYDSTENWSVNGDGSGNAIISPSFKVEKRAASTMVAYRATGQTGSWDYQRNGATSTGGVTFDRIGTNTTRCYTGIGANWASASLFGHWTADAEL